MSTIVRATLAAMVSGALGVGCASLPRLGDHTATRRYPLACAEDTQVGGGAPRRLVRTFDVDERVARAVQLDADGAPVWTTTYTWVGRTVTVRTVGPGERVVERVDQYDAEGRRIGATTASDGSAGVTRVVEERVDGQLRSTATYDAAGTLIERATHTYDPFGNRTVTTVQPRDRPSRRTTLWYGCWTPGAAPAVVAQRTL